ncbi:MAG: tRNA (N6-isopentenyl adenosine(37)-C2)-methylthiotransferase MiaB [Bdellovibrionales bacterium]|nr:tRNA (N6-isopentenyl adenosine(37)-C2)-methylthiotransferase MiaB [Bdellovibrionales bacterium]
MDRLNHKITGLSCSKEKSNKVGSYFIPQKNVYISNYGCQMNVNDTERMYSLLEMINYAPAVSPDQAQLIIINSCSVREKPVHKVRSEVGRYCPLKKKNPQLKIGVAGCVAQQEKKKLLKDIPLLDFVFGPDAIDDLPHIVSRLEHGENNIVEARFTHSQPYHVQTLIRDTQVSAFVNITKGCDNFCTFCVVPFTRGRERSRPLNHVCEDVQNLVKRGVKEVTLLGQNVNSYRSDCGATFACLLLALCEKTDIKRIRFTSPHPKDFNEELMEIIQSRRDKIMSAIHLPAQSGNSRILEQMNRGYTREEYIEKADMILDKMPGAVLSTDLIVGFPGETEEDFQDTLSLLDKVPFEMIYSFKYSPRPFTKAARFDNPVSEKEKSHRLARLNQKHNQFAFSRSQKYKNQVLEVLVEKKDGKVGYLSGRSCQNKLVHFQGSAHLKGKIVSVKINKTYPQVLYGELLF